MPNLWCNAAMSRVDGMTEAGFGRSAIFSVAEYIKVLQGLLKWQSIRNISRRVTRLFLSVLVGVTGVSSRTVNRLRRRRDARSFRPALLLTGTFRRLDCLQQAVSYSHRPIAYGRKRQCIASNVTLRGASISIVLTVMGYPRQWPKFTTFRRSCRLSRLTRPPT